MLTMSETSHDLKRLVEYVDKNPEQTIEVIALVSKVFFTERLNTN